MARAGIADLITRLRGLTNAGTADFTLTTETYFSDDHLQTILDSNVTPLEGIQMTWLPDTVGGGSLSYHRAATMYRDLEEATSGTIYWNIRDSTGALQGTAGYTANYIDGIIRFDADQEGTAYYLTARSYDLYGAAADVWLRRQAYYANWYDFQSDDQRFSRKQAFDNAVAMERQMRAQSGANTGPGAFKSTRFVRKDINRYDY